MRMLLRARFGHISHITTRSRNRRFRPILERLEERRLLAAVGVADFYEVDENQAGTPNTLEAASVLNNDSGATVAEVAAGPAHAAAFAFNADGTFTYTPATGYSGQDAFTYRPGDGSAFGDPVTVSIKVNRQPLALSGDYDYQGGNGPVQFHIADFAYDIDDTEFMFVPPLDDWHLQGPIHGTVALSADKQTFTYTPNADYTGDDSFQFRVNDGHISSNEGTIRLHNIGSSVPVVANDDAYEMAAGTTLSLPAPFLLMNDDNNSGTGTLSVNGFTPSAEGSVQVNADGSFAFTPSAGFAGSATFTYTVTNGSAVSSPATVRIDVSAAAQVAAGDYYFVPTGQTISITGPGVLANDVFSGAAPAANIEKGVSQGAIALNTDGGFTYTAPASPAEPFAYFRYQHDSGGSADRIATVYFIFTAAPANVVDGTGGDDAFEVATDAATGEVVVSHTPAGGGMTVRRFPAGTASLAINGLGGNDTVTIDLAGNTLAANIEFDGGDGLDTLALVSMPAGQDLSLVAGSLQLNAGQVSHIQVEGFALEATPALDLIDLHSLTVDAGLRLTLPNDPAVVLRTTTLNLGSGTTLDLRKTALVVQTPAGLAVPFNDVRNLVGAARNGSTLWGGSGITTSSADGNHGLLTLLNDASGSTILPSLGSAGLDTRSVIVLYALNGDGNADGVVDGRDYLHLDYGHLGDVPATPQAGDIDYSGGIDGDDYFLADQAFLMQMAALAADAPPMAAALEEPSPAVTVDTVRFSAVPILPLASSGESDTWDSPVRDLLTGRSEPPLSA